MTEPILVTLFMLLIGALGLFIFSRRTKDWPVKEITQDAVDHMSQSVLLDKMWDENITSASMFRIQRRLIGILYGREKK
jgi:hypothetical protein